MESFAISGFGDESDLDSLLGTGAGCAGGSGLGIWILNGTSEEERETVGSSADLSPLAFAPPKNFPRICSALDMAGSDQGMKGDEEDRDEDDGG